MASLLSVLVCIVENCVFCYDGKDIFDIASTKGTGFEIVLPFIGTEAEWDMDARVYNSQLMAQEGGKVTSLTF